MELALTAVYGANASQTATDLVIKKSDLTGLTPDANNRADALFVGQLLVAEAAYTATAQGTNPDQSIRIERGSRALTTDFTTNVTYEEIPFTVTLRTVYTPGSIDPDNY